MRKLTETIQPEGTTIVLELTSDDGLKYTETVEVPNNHKQFENNLKDARAKLSHKRVWLNARKALSLEEIKQLDNAAVSNAEV